MKTIVIATDFSPAANNAADYGAQLSKITDSSIVLFHSWSLPVMSSETLAVPISMEELEEAAMKNLQDEAERLGKNWGVSVEVKQNTGFAKEEILNCAMESHADLVIMGMEHRNKIGQFLGSVSTSFLHPCKFPTLIIPEQISFVTPHTFLMATDLHSSEDWKEFKTFSEIANCFNVGIHVLNVVQTEFAATESEGRQGIKLEGRLKEFPHTWHFPNDGDVVHGILKTAKEIAADWIAVVPHQLSWAKNIFHKSVSNQLTFMAEYPILALPEK